MLNSANIDQYNPNTCRIHGGYDILNMIPVTDVLSDLTGGVSEVIDLKEFG